MSIDSVVGCEVMSNYIVMIDIHVTMRASVVVIMMRSDWTCMMNVVVSHWWSD